MSEADYIGQKFGNYIIIEFINSGQFGSVFKAKHKYFKDDPIVAIKILHSHFGSSEKRKQFITEAQLLRELKHPYILPVMDVGFENDILYMIIEYAVGGTLKNRIKKQAGQPFPIAESIKVITQVGEALHYAHQQEQHVVHCDLKPDNILFNAEGDVLLADFGIAAILATTGTKMLGNGGTPNYMAPEQFKGLVSPKIDQYALGCIAYELFAGRHPYNLQGANALAAQYQHSQVEPVAPTTYNPQLPSHIETAIRTAMAKDRNNRYSNVAVFLAALQKMDEQNNALNDAGRYEETLDAARKLISREPTIKLVMSQQSTVPITSEQLFQEGVRVQAKGNIEEAFRIWRQLTTTPGIAEKYSAAAQKRIGELRPQMISLLPKQARAASMQGRWQDEIRMWEGLLWLQPSAWNLAPLLTLPLTPGKEKGDIMQSIQVRLRIAQQNEQFAWMYTNAQQFIQNRDIAAARTQLQMLWRDAPYYGDPAGLAPMVGLPAALNYEQAIVAAVEQARIAKLQIEQARTIKEKKQKHDEIVSIFVVVGVLVAILAAILGAGVITGIRAGVATGIATGLGIVVGIALFLAALDSIELWIHSNIIIYVVTGISVAISVAVIITGIVTKIGIVVGIGAGIGAGIALSIAALWLFRLYFY